MLQAVKIPSLVHLFSKGSGQVSRYHLRGGDVGEETSVTLADF